MILGQRVRLRVKRQSGLHASIFAILVHRTPEYDAFTIPKRGVTLMRGYQHDEPRYGASCALCGEFETEDPTEDSRLRTFYIDTSSARLSPAHQTLFDALGGPGYGNLCLACISSLTAACELSGLPTPKFWLSPASR